MSKTPTDVFQDEILSNSKCKYLADNPEQAICWEEVSVSDFSPCLVQDAEYIARQIHSPIHIDLDSGDIKTAAFNDAFDKGLSVNRVSYTSEENIHSLGELKAKRDRERRSDRNYIGFVKAKVINIRKCLEGTKRVFVVLDTALKDIPDHADLCAIRLGANENEEPVLPKKAARKKRRLTLKKIFSSLKLAPKR